MKLRGRRALVTGASGGLGSAIARGLAAEGAAVALHARDPGSVEELRREIRLQGGVAVVVPGDVKDVGDVDSMINASVAELGGLDLLVNNAGIMSTAPFLELAPQEWDDVISVNLRGYFLVGQRAAKEMVAAGYGSIINVSSTRQVQAWPGSTAYCASKGGIAMLTKVMALELAPLGVRVNSVAPGTIPTGLNRDYLADEDFIKQRVASIPAGRLGDPTDVVAAIVLLASDDAAFVVGASLMIDGGQTLW